MSDFFLQRKNGEKKNMNHYASSLKEDSLKNASFSGRTTKVLPSLH